MTGGSNCHAEQNVTGLQCSHDLNDNSSRMDQLLYEFEGMILLSLHIANIKDHAHVHISLYC